MEEKKQKRWEQMWEIAAKNKELKRARKTEKEKEDKEELWSRLKELNNNFAKMKEHKKLNHKKKKLYLWPKYSFLALLTL